jgi:hypothetical protein
VTILPRFGRKAGMEKADVLQKEPAKTPSSLGGVFNRYVACVVRLLS